MALNSIPFLIFIIIIFSIYYSVCKEDVKKQNILLLLSSYFFYGYIDFRMLLILISATLIFYYLGIKIQSSRKSKSYCTIGIILGCGFLLYFKYFNFFIDSFVVLANNLGIHINLKSLKILVPLGISFFTFKLISYTLETYKRRIAGCKDIVIFSLYISFFPTIMSGPIDRPYDFLPQLNIKRTFNEKFVVQGLRQFLWGMFKKMVIADNIAIIVNNAWSNLSSQSSLSLIIISMLYTIQIYADFSGYSDMAIGIGKTLGLKITKNFQYPYLSRNLQEFWRRWHISLTSWLTDYIYIPLGGNRCSPIRHLLNIMITRWRN